MPYTSEQLQTVLSGKLEAACAAAGTTPRELAQALGEGLAVAATAQHGRCKDCTHWSREGLTPERAHGGRCKSRKLGEEYSPLDADALVYDYHEGGGFWTGPEFGCVHWRRG